MLEQFPDKEETALGFAFLRTTNDAEALARLYRYEMGISTQDSARASPGV